MTVCENDSINHAVVMVGFTGDSWILQNSWGRYWGENGYFRLSAAGNTCGILGEFAIPIY